jgi:CubicO group peptidase (beta-lactamase class C family)
MNEPRRVDRVWVSGLYPQMYTMLRTALRASAAMAILARPGAAQKPVPPGPPTEQESPAAAPTPVAPRLERADVEAWVDGFLPYAIERGDIAGAVVAVVKDGQVLFEKGYGYADVKRRRPVDPARTLFRPGSVSKLFTWTAVMQLVEQGKLDLDRDVNAYLDFKVPDAFGAPVTLRNAMTHTAGFEEVDKNVITSDSTDILPLGTFLKAWTPTRIFPPGKVPAYSNYATALAGYIVQRVSGEPFDEYVERHIFAPLGMEHASFRQPLPPRLRQDAAEGYDQASSGTPKPYEMVAPAPAGSLAASGDDMARFMIAHLQNGRFGQGEILKPETAKLMHGTALTILPRVNRMLLGFYETNRNGRRAIAHGGDTYYFHSDLHLFVDDGVGIFLSMNSGGKEGATSAIRSAFFEQFTDRYLPGEEHDGKVDSATAAAHARLLAGTYVNSRRSESNFIGLLGLLGPGKVTVNDDGTVGVSFLEGLNGEPKRWREIEPFVWREVDGKNLLAARVENGRVTMFSGDEISPFMVFMPPPAWKAPALLKWSLIGAIVALLLTVVAWPVAALVRRHYHAAYPLEGRQALAHKWVRIAAAATVVVLVGWGFTVQTILSEPPSANSPIDGRLLVLKLAGLVVFVAAALVALWHARVVWTGGRRWPARTWSVVLAAASVVVLLVAVTFGLVGFSTHY